MYLLFVLYPDSVLQIAEWLQNRWNGVKIIDVRNRMSETEELTSTPENMVYVSLGNFPKCSDKIKRREEGGIK